MKVGKLIIIIGMSLLLFGCDNEVDRLEDKVDLLEDKIDALLDQNNINSSNDSVINNGEGTTTVDTSNIENTIKDYENKANDLLDSINKLSPPSNRSDAINLFWEWKVEIEKLDNEIDTYEDKLERMYRNNTLSYNDFRNYDYDLESIGDILDKAEDNLEFITNYDD